MEVDECQAEMREWAEVHLIHQLVSNYRILISPPSTRQDDKGHQLAVGGHG